MALDSSEDQAKHAPDPALGTPLPEFGGSELSNEAVPTSDRHVSFLDCLPIGYVTFDGAGCITEANRAAAELLRKDAATLYGVPFQEFVAKADQEKFSIHLKRCAESSLHRVVTQLHLDSSLEQLVELVSHVCVQGSTGALACHTVINNRTELHTLLESVQESEERFRTLAGASFEGIVLSEAGRFVEVNRQFAQMLGYEPAQLVGTEIESIVAPEDRARVVGNIMKGIDTLTEHGALCRNGERITVEAHGRTINYMGRTVRVTAIRDVTERKRSEEALRRSEMVYRAIGETINYGIWICDPQGRNTYASPSFLELVGMTQEQCSEYGWGDVLHPDDAPATIAAWKECALTGSFWERYHRYRGVDGRYHHILARGVPVRDEQGTILFWAGINLDVDDIKQTEEALRQSEERLRYHMENSPLAVVEWGNDTRVMHWSREAERMFGWTTAEVTGKPIDQLPIIHAEDAQIGAETIERLKSGVERTLVFNNRNVTRDGRTLHCVWYNSVLTDAAGKMASVMSLILDVTEEHDAKASLEAMVESMRILVANSVESVALVGDDGVVRCISGHAASALGTVPAQVEGKNCLEFVPQEQLLRARYHFADLLRDPRAPLTTTLKLQVAGGPIFWFSLSVSTVSLGESRGYLVRLERLSDIPGKVPGAPQSG